MAVGLKYQQRSEIEQNRSIYSVSCLINNSLPHRILLSVKLKARILTSKWRFLTIWISKRPGRINGWPGQTAIYNILCILFFFEFHKQVKPNRQGDRSPELSTVLCAVVIFRVIFSLPRQPTSPTYEMTPVLKPFIVLWRFLHK